MVHSAHANLLNLYCTYSDSQMLNDRNYQDVDEEYLRSIIGFVEQDPTFLNYLTIAENIAYGDNTRNIGKQEIIEAAKLVRITSFIDRLPQVTIACLLPLYKFSLLANAT